MAQTYYAILTAIGEAKLANAAALGTTLQLTKMAVGDGNGNTPQPSRDQKALVHETRRAPLNQLSIDPANPSQIVAEQIIPEDVGGWWIRELGLYDAAGDLCAVANCPDTYKPVLASGSGRTQIIRMVLIVSNTAAVELKVDSSVVLAPRSYVDQVMATHGAAVDPHPQYAKHEDLLAHANAADPHPQYTTDQEVISAIDARTAAAGFAKKSDTNVWTRGQAGQVAPLPTTAGTVTLDLSLANNWEGTLTGNITLANPSKLPVGQCGVIRIIQPAAPAAPCVIAYGSVFKGAAGVLPTLTPVASAVDVIGYYVESDQRILLVLQGDVK